MSRLAIIVFIDYSLSSGMSVLSVTVLAAVCKPTTNYWFNTPVAHVFGSV